MTKAPLLTSSSCKSKLSPARLAALHLCARIRQRDAFAQDLLASSEEMVQLSSEDRAFCTLLVRGIVSSSGTLDDIINRALKNPDSLQPEVRDALRVGAYEIVFLKKSPHAAVYQGVELVRRIQPRAAGLANAVLRRVVDEREHFPFGDPRQDVAALARLCAFPLWLTRRLMADLGPKQAVSFMQASNEPAPLFVAVNELRATPAEVCGVFSECDVAYNPVSVQGVNLPGCYRLEQPVSLQLSSVKKLFDQGKLLVSDAASQLVVKATLPAHMPASFLEIGAGRGTKSILFQNAALRHFGSQMNLTSLDNHAFKGDILTRRARDYGVQVNRVLTADATKLTTLFPRERFDAVFVDAPCSGLGTLRRHPEIRWRLTQARINELAQNTLAMLSGAASVVAPGGSLVLSTCTVTQAENASTVKRFLESPEGASFQLVPLYAHSCLCTTLTSGSCDAHFAVKFIKARQ